MKQTKQLWLSLLSGCLAACTCGLDVAGQEPIVDAATGNTSANGVSAAAPAALAAATAPAAPNAPASPQSPTEASEDDMSERPPRPPRPSPSSGTSDEAPSSDGAPTDTGVRSSTWTDSAEQTATNHELSIEPSTLPLLPDDAPAWVGSLPDLTADVHRLFVGGHIAESESSAAQGLDAPLIVAVRQYVEDYLLHSPRAGDALAGKLTVDYVWKNLIDQHSGYVAKLNTLGQPMYQKWVTVAITPEQRDEIRRWHLEVQQRARLAPIGFGVTSLLGCVGLVHLVLRRKSGRDEAGAQR